MRVRPVQQEAAWHNLRRDYGRGINHVGVGRFVTRFDAVPEFWQFLNGLTGADLIAELIQNELDAESTHTVISFTPSVLICAGNGVPIDVYGWKRLSVLRGAGDEVPAKRNRIGVKNHGLKACFTIGDEIKIRSGGKSTVQTLYAKGSDSPPYPGAYEFPIDDPTAPVRGCEIEVAFRTHVLRTPVGEPLEFEVADEEKISALFLTACEDIPRRFLGIIHPSRRHYTLRLEHHRLGTAQFEFRLKWTQPSGRDACFSRECRITGTAIQKHTRTEIAYGTYTKWPNDMGGAPEFYRAKRGAIYVEVACELDKRGRPTAVDGLKRYPISYTGDARSAKSGRGAHYSAPFVSDQERHGAAGTASNAELVAVCDSVLVRFLRNYLVEKFGVESLSVAMAPGPAQEDVIHAIVNQLLSAQAIPLASRGSTSLKFGPRRSRGQFKPVVVPSYTWSPGVLVRQLQQLCPPDCDQVHPDVPMQIVSALADSELPGWQETHVTFDENDVLSRAQPERYEAYFPWAATEQWQRFLSDPHYSNAGLDVVLQCLEHDVISKEDMKAVQEALYVAGADSRAHRLTTMYSSLALPDLREPLTLPPLIHPDLGRHALFRKRDWRLPAYSVNAFIADIKSNELMASDARSLWNWFNRAAAEIPLNAWREVGTLPIWPSSNGSRCTFAELCDPHDSFVKRTMAHILNCPHRDVLKLLGGRPSKRSGLRMRAMPTETEVERYYAGGIGQWPLNEPLPEGEQKAFQHFEDILDRLVTHSELARIVGRLPCLVTLARDGSLRQTTMLHKDTLDIAALYLEPCDLAARVLTRLDAAYRFRAQASGDAVVRALQCTPELQAQLFPRLRSALRAFAAEGRNTEVLSEIPCVNHEGSLINPGAIALRGNRSDYWGKWKVSIATNTLTQEQASTLKQCGALPAEPTRETSKQFFQWLQLQSQESLRASVPMALRHLLHRNGVQSWWQDHPSAKCVLVEHGNELKLVSYSEVSSPQGRVYIPDFEELAEAIRSAVKNERVLLAVINNVRVSDSVAEVLRDAGAKSLYDAAQAAHHVRHGVGALENNILLSIVNELRSSRMAGLKKKLAAIQFPVSYLREHWRDRLRNVKAVRVTELLTETYRIGGRNYEIPVNAAFNEATGEIWLLDTATEALVVNLFDAIAARIFDGAPRYASAVLRSAITVTYDEREWFQDDQETNDDDLVDSGWMIDRQMRQITTHGLRSSASDLPEPRPLPTTPSRQVRERPVKERGESQRAPVQLESEQIQNLKALHYAWHCQMCLSEQPPEVLAPTSSYAAVIGNRQQMIDAHHPDQVHTRGARHAGNILILCHAHHHAVGETISRRDVYSALLDAHEKSVAFQPVSDRGEDPITIIGFEAAVLGRDGIVARLFFTKDHRAYWLHSAEQEGAGVEQSA